MRPSPPANSRSARAALFDRDDFGPEVMHGMMPAPADAGGVQPAFRSHRRDAPRRLHVRPSAGDQNLRRHRDAADRAQAGQRSARIQGPSPPIRPWWKASTKASSTRIARTSSAGLLLVLDARGLDLGRRQEEQVQATFADINAAIAAAKKVAAPFKLATCGWVLGPQDDRAAFDQRVAQGHGRELHQPPGGHDPGRAAASPT